MPGAPSELLGDLVRVDYSRSRPMPPMMRRAASTHLAKASRQLLVHYCCVANTSYWHIASVRGSAANCCRRRHNGHRFSCVAVQSELLSPRGYRSRLPYLFHGSADLDGATLEHPKDRPNMSRPEHEASDWLVISVLWRNGPRFRSGERRFTSAETNKRTTKWQQRRRLRLSLRNSTPRSGMHLQMRPCGIGWRILSYELPPSDQQRRRRLVRCRRLKSKNGDSPPVELKRPNACTVR